MNRLVESFSIFRSLKGGQKFVIIRIFISISVMAFIFGHRLWSSDAVVSLILAATVLGMELCFITWLGQMRGRSYHQATLDQAGFQFKPVRVWPSYVGRFVLAFVFFGVVAGAASSFDEVSDAVIYLRVPIYVVQTLLLGLSLLQGLRLGWHAVVASEGAGAAAMTTRQVMPPDVIELTSPSTAAAAGPFSPMQRIQPNRTARWLQVIFGSISIIATTAAIAIYVHGQQASTDSARDAQDPDPLTKALSEPYTLQNQSTTQPPTQAAAQPESATPPAPAPAQATPTLTSETYGNRVASFFPGESAEDAIMDGLSKINSSISVDSIDTLGYPAYSLECEKNDQCVNGTGAPFGSTGDNAKEMFPVNPSDIQQYGLKCDVICYDSQGRIIGRDPNFHG